MIYSSNRTNLEKSKYDEFNEANRNLNEAFDDVIDYMNSCNYLDEATCEIIEEGFSDAVNKIKSLFTSSLNKIKKKKNEVDKLSKDISELEKKYTDVKKNIDYSKLSIGIAAYEPLEDIDNIKKNTQPLMNQMYQIFSTAYNEIADSTESPEKYKKDVAGNPNFLSDRLKTVRKNYKDFDVEKKVDALFGMSNSKGEEKVHVITNADVALFIKGRDNIEAVLKNISNYILDFEDHTHQLNQGVEERNKVRGEWLKNTPDSDQDKDYYRYTIEASKALSTIYTMEFSAFDKFCGCFTACATEYYRRLNSYLTKIEAIIQKMDSNGKISEGAVEAESSEVLQESKKLLHYGRTKKIEKYYHIPDKFCIERDDFKDMDKGGSSLIYKAENASTYIKNQTDILNYFMVLLQDVFWRYRIQTSNQLSQVSKANELYNLYLNTYKGNNGFDKDDLFIYVTNNIAMSNAAMAYGAATTLFQL